MMGDYPHFLQIRSAEPHGLHGKLDRGGQRLLERTVLANDRPQQHDDVGRVARPNCGQYLSPESHVIHWD